VQIIIDVKDSKAVEIFENTKAYIAGWATAEEVDSAPKRDFGSKLGELGGYKCFYIPIKQLRPMSIFKTQYNKNH
jgi:hypothetical protein